MNQIFAFDFSMNKPAMVSHINNKIEFYAWPLSIDKISKEKLSKCNINIFDRNLPKVNHTGLDEHQLILEHVRRAIDLANMIVDTMNSILKNNNVDKDYVIVANEGFAFGSKGNACLDLSGYKYILMYILIQNGYKHFRTFAPIQLKKIAGCSKRGLRKNNMIEALANENELSHKFIKTIKYSSNELKKKTAYVMCTDDLADAYWCLKKTIENENG